MTISFTSDPEVNSTAVLPNRRGLKDVRKLVRWLDRTVGIDTRTGHGTSIVVGIPVLEQDGRAGDVAGDRLS